MSSKNIDLEDNRSEVSIKVNEILALKKLLEKLKISGTSLIIEAGKELGGPKKTTVIVKMKLDEVEDGLVVCPNCLNVYSFKNLYEFIQNSGQNEDFMCFSCQKIRLNDMLKVALEIKRKMRFVLS